MSLKKNKETSRKEKCSFFFFDKTMKNVISSNPIFLFLPLHSYSPFVVTPKLCTRIIYKVELSASRPSAPNLFILEIRI